VLRSRRTRRFRALLAALPADVQRQARDAYQLFRANPRHPSLRFKGLPENNLFDFPADSPVNRPES